MDTPIKFKRGDYIVWLEEPDFHTRCGKLNYCFKIRLSNEINKRAVNVEVDLSGNKNSNNALFNVKFRPATPAEIAEYNRLNKPFDVTTLKPINQIITHYEIF